MRLQSCWRLWGLAAFVAAVLWHQKIAASRLAFEVDEEETIHCALFSSHLHLVYICISSGLLHQQLQYLA